MIAKTFLEIHDALLNKKPITQCDFKGDKEGLYNGLCGVWLNDSQLKDNQTFQMFVPTCGFAYWAEDIEETPIGQCGYNYNDLRQNIILFCAAMNEEL